MKFYTNNDILWDAANCLINNNPELNDDNFYHRVNESKAQKYMTINLTE